MSVIKVRLDRFPNTHSPMLHLDGGPFIDAELSPHRARCIADLLNQLAALAEQQDTHNRRFHVTRQEIEA